jgi:LacI family transcriptional regulator
MATIADVARLAGVATSTVSHVLNGTRFVSAETTSAVREAVRALGYAPNTVARALARSTTNTIGLAISSTKNRYFSDVINAIEEECSKLGMMVLLANTRDDPECEFEMVAALHQRRVDGIIIAPSCGLNNSALTYLREQRIPSVMVDRLPDVALDGVGVENRQSLAAMVAHMG